MDEPASERGRKQAGKFAGDILVCCPRCGAVAHVLALVRLTCPSCSLRQIRAKPRRFGANGTSYERGAAHPEWHGAFRLIADGNARCTTCGNALNIPRKISYTSTRPAGHAIEQDIACTVCQTQNRIKAIWVPYHDPSDARDPSFGCQLHLIEQTAKGTVWAYNKPHAESLLDWVTSPTRPRGATAIPDAMAARLPGWMKSAANRSAMVKALERFLERVTAI